MIRKSLQVCIAGSNSAVNSHLPSAESAGVSLSTLACLRTGPELDLDGIAISDADVRNLQFGFQSLVFFQIVVALAQRNTASAVGVISMISRDRLAAIFGSDLDLEVCRTDRQTKLGGAFQIEFAGQAEDVDEFSFDYPTPVAFIAEAPDGTFTEKEEEQVIRILKSFKVAELD